MALTKAKASNILLTTPAASSNDTTPATTAYVTTAINNLIDSSPSALNTLNELAAALNDDANFSTTVTNSIATKLPLAGGTMTGALLIDAGTVSATGLGFAGDTNTGLYAPAADQIGFVAAGSRKLLLTSTDAYFQNLSGMVTFGDRIKIQDASSHQLNIGQWDSTYHRIEGDSNKPMLITSYHSDGISLGGSGAQNLNLINGRLGYNTGSNSAGNAMTYPITINSGNTSGNVIESYRTANSVFYIYQSTGGQHYIDAGGSSPELKFRLGTSSDYFRLKPTDTFSLYPILQGGATTVAGISTGGGSMADVNGAEVGPGYLNLGRDDTAQARQIAFSKNGSFHSSISTLTRGLEVYADGGTSSVQFTNGVGEDVLGVMTNQGHTWQNNVYNTISAGNVSIGGDSSGTSHMWWNTYDTGSKYNVKAGYGMDMYHAVATGEFVMRMGQTNASQGGSQTLQTRFRLEKGGQLGLSKAPDSAYALDAAASVGGIRLNCTASGANSVGLSGTLPGYASNLYGNFFSSGNNIYFVLGGSYVGYISSNGQYNVSDERLKKDVTNLTGSLDKIKQLRGVNFKWIDEERGTDNNIGFIAQEVESIIPEVVDDGGLPNDENGEAPMKNVSYEHIVPHLVEAIKELEARVKELEG